MNKNAFKFLLLNTIAGPAILTSPFWIGFCIVLLSPIPLVSLVWIYAAFAPSALVYSTVVWRSIAVTGGISLEYGMAGCVVAAILMPYAIETLADRRLPTDLLSLKRFPLMYGGFLMNCVAALVMSAIARKRGIINNGPTNLDS